MKIKNMLLKILCLVFIFSTISLLPVVTEFAGAASPKSIKMGVPSVGSGSYIRGVGHADLITKYTPMNCRVEVVGGTDANLRALREGLVQLATIQLFGATSAYFGSYQFTGEPKIPVRLLVQGFATARQVVIRNRSGVKTLKDLEGKRFVCIRPGGADQEMIANAMLKVYGVDKTKVKYIKNSKTRETVDALISGAVAAAIIPGTPPSGTIARLAQTVDVSFFHITPDKMKEVLQELPPGFISVPLRKGLYKGLDREIRVVGMGTGYVIRADVSDEVAYSAAKIIIERREEAAKVHKSSKHYTVKNALNDFTLPFHPGSIKYFKEVGAWTEEYEKRQQRLLKKGGVIK